VITGNYNFIKNEQLRKLFAKGPKYRLHQKIDVEMCGLSILDGLTKYIDKVSSRLNKDSDLFKFWIDRIVKQWIAKAKENSVNVCGSKLYDETLTKPQISALKAVQKHFVITLVDKASQNYGFICKKYYLSQLNKELSSNVYELIHKDETEIIELTSKSSKNCKFVLPNENKKLPNIYIIPKFHKNPISFRTIIASKKCTTKIVSNAVSKCLSAIMQKRKMYCESIFNATGYNLFWIISNNKPILQTLKQLNDQKRCRTVETYDFTTLYTTLDHVQIFINISEIIDKTFNEDYELKICGEKAYWLNSKSEVNITKDKLKEMVKFIVENTFFGFGDKVYKQNVGVPMGTDCAPHIANLMLHNMEFNYLNKLIKNKKFEILGKLNNTYRYIDDITIINGNGILENIVAELYHPSLKLIKVNTNPTTADVLDIHINITNKISQIKTYDKRRSFNFNIVNFPHINSNIPQMMCYNVYKEQVHRHSLLNSNVTDFSKNIVELNYNVSLRGYDENKLYDSFSTIVKKHKINERYNVSHDSLINKIF